MSTFRWVAAVLAVALAAGCGGDRNRGEASPPQPSGVGAGAALQSLLDGERARYGAPGAVAVVRAGDQRWVMTSGTADVSGTPVDPTGTFRIASITKPLVATLVLQAVARGQLSLADNVGRLLPGVVPEKPAVTVRNLLNHTSGIFDELNEGDAEADVARLEDPALVSEARRLIAQRAAGTRAIASDRLLVALAETHDRYFPPGSAYHYSNTNYQLAAMVLEKVTGQSLSTLLRTGIVEPLGLQHTTVTPPDLAPPSMRGYVVGDGSGARVDVTDDLLAFGNGGNGGVLSTPDELLTILRAIVTARLLPSALVGDMTTPAMGDYGLGLATYSTRCGTFYGHGGAVNGTGSTAMVSKDGRDGIVIAQNLLGDREADLPGLAEDMICTAAAG